MTVAALEHGSGIVLGQTEVPDKTNEIPAVRDLCRALGLRGRTVKLDAMHSYSGTARVPAEECGADYVMTAAEDNQPTI